MSVKLDLKNKLINGSLEYWQRNTSFAAIADNTYTADRWVYTKSGSMVHTVSRSTDVPADAFSLYSIQTATTTGTAVGTGAELATNSGFDSNITGWTIGGIGATASWSSGSLLTNTLSTNAVWAYQEVSGLVIGKTYILEAGITTSSSDRESGVQVLTSGGGSLIASNTSNTSTYKQISVTFVATATTHRIQAYYNRLASSYMLVNYISLKEAANVNTTDFASISQRIEGNLLRTFKNKKMVLKFRVKAFKPGTYCVSFRNSAQDRSLVKEYKVNASNTWETKIIRFEHDSTGAWLYDNGMGMRLSFIIAAGSSFHASANSWITGNFLATSNQVNGVDTSLNNFYITDVCLVEDNEGQTRDPDFVLAGRDVFEELQLCQRYYEIMNNFYMRSYSHGGGYAKLVPKRISPIVAETSIVNNNTPGPSREAVEHNGIAYSFSAISTALTSTKFTISADAEL